MSTRRPKRKKIRNGKSAKSVKKRKAAKGKKPKKAHELPEPLGLDLIGYWASGSAEDPTGYPDPRDLVGTWEPTDRQNVIAYLASGIAFRNYMGPSHCRLCESPLGAAELSDGTWAWPEGLEHYVEAHNIRLPEAFVDTARRAHGQVPQSAKETLGRPQLWVEAGAGGMPVEEAPGRPIFMRAGQWLDWSMEQTEARPAPDAISTEDARRLCTELSHRTWTAQIEEMHGRWRVVCVGSESDPPDIFYTERRSRDDLERRLLTWRHPDPDALLHPRAAHAIAEEYDGSWGSARLVAGSEYLWLIWVKPPGADNPTEAEIKQVLDGNPQLGWAAFMPNGAKALPAPHMDEKNWRFALERIRKEFQAPGGGAPKKGNGHS